MAQEVVPGARLNSAMWVNMFRGTMASLSVSPQRHIRRLSWRRRRTVSLDMFFLVVTLIGDEPGFPGRHRSHRLPKEAILRTLLGLLFALSDGYGNSRCRAGAYGAHAGSGGPRSQELGRAPRESWQLCV